MITIMNKFKLSSNNLMNPILEELNKLDIQKLALLISSFNCTNVSELSKKLERRNVGHMHNDRDIFGDRHWSKQLNLTVKQEQKGNDDDSDDFNIFKMGDKLAKKQLNPQAPAFKLKPGLNPYAPEFKVHEQNPFGVIGDKTVPKKVAKKSSKKKPVKKIYMPKK